MMIKAKNETTGRAEPGLPIGTIMADGHNAITKKRFIVKKVGRNEYERIESGVSSAAGG